MPWVERVPERLVHPLFWAEPLQEKYAELDVDAYTSSPHVINAHSHGRWQVNGFTLAEEKSMLADHHLRHRAKQDFAFIVLAPDGAHSLGCFYILPLISFLKRVSAEVEQVSDRSAMVTFWIRQSKQKTDLAKHLVNALHSWLRSEWQFDDHFFRVNPQELNSIAALRANSLREVFSISTPLPYFFFGG